MLSTLGYVILGFFIGFMLRRIKDYPSLKCAFFWHQFRWKHYNGDPLMLKRIPNHARCEHCGIRYGNE